MRIAVLADVHANRSALDAVMTSVAQHSPDAVLVLGDLVGYCADPGFCIDATRELATWVVAGNHDVDASRREATDGTSSSARAVQTWTRTQLSDSQLGYLRELPDHALFVPGCIAAHGSYLGRSYVSGYVTSTMLEANLTAISSRPDGARLALCGHTHIPMCGWLARGSVQEHTLREPVTWPASAEAVLLNPGAVGQPRDGDPRASFMILDLSERRAACHRVDYPIADTVDHIARSGLPEDLGARLWEGR